LSKKKSSFLIRALTLGVGAISNFVIATILLQNLGPEGFGRYVLLTSLPSLIPFADFGMGANIFNYYADKARGLKVINPVSDTFYLSTFLSIAIFLLLMTTTLLLSQFTNLMEEISNGDIFIGLTILLITFLAVPFSIAAKKMFAEERISLVMFVQGLIPPIVLTLVYTFFEFKIYHSYFLFLFPCVAYLISTYIIFFLSQIQKDFTHMNLDNLTSRVKVMFSLGRWSLCVTTVIGLVWQTPKYIIQWVGSADDLTEYSLMSLVLIPGLSFSGVAATWLTTNVRRVNFDFSVRALISQSRKSALLVSVIFSLSAFLGLQILSWFGLEIPDLRSQMIASLILFLSPFWILPLSVFTNIKDLRWISLRILPCFFLANLIFAISFRVGYEFAILIYTACIFLPFYYFSLIRIRNL